MKKFTVLFMFWLFAGYSYAQSVSPQKYSAQQLKQDIDFLKQQLFDAHANPFTELSKAQYDRLFDSISSQITDSADATTFYKLVKPVFAHLSDEHANIDIDTNRLNGTYKNGRVFLPFTLAKQGDAFIIDDILSPNSGLTKGEVVARVNDVQIAQLVRNCSLYTTGFPAQRIDRAVDEFGYFYGWSFATPRDEFTISTGDGKLIKMDGITLQPWLSYITLKNHNAQPSAPRITYTRFKDAAYINSSTFLTHNDKDFEVLKSQIDSIFRLVKADGIKTVFIDVSKNSGGNSSVGDVLISYIYGKPYLTYQCNWRRSDEYLRLIKSWGITDSAYIQKPVGSVIHFDSEQSYPPQENPNRFNGKVYIIIGNGTFSSAMMFATIVKDNHIAELIGQTPQNGHPDHFGELYNAELPNTKLKYRFGVKEWIRPAGKLSDNYLRPDKIIDIDKYPDINDLAKDLAK